VNYGRMEKPVGDTTGPVIQVAAATVLDESASKVDSLGYGVKLFHGCFTFAVRRELRMATKHDWNKAKPHDVDTGRIRPKDWAEKHPDRVEWVKDKPEKPKK
jgi:hypothetical protein